MKKKIILMVSTLVCMLALCSCGKSEVDLNGLSETQLQSACEQTAGVLEGLSADESEQYYTYYASQDDGEIYADLMQQWIDIQPQIGDFVGYKDFSVTKAGKTISAVQTISFTQCDVKLTYVINANSLETTAINVEMVYSLGETMAKAGLNTVMSISIVFIILILISLVISAFKVIPVIQAKFAGKEETPAPKAVVAAPVATDETDDTELIAVIAAAIAASTGSSTDDFVVRSIKRRY